MSSEAQTVSEKNGREERSCPVCVTGLLSHFRNVGEQHYLRCGQCAATVMAPESRLTAVEEKRVYELHDNDPADAGYRRFLGKLAGPLMARLPSGARGLDFGCGPGPALAMMFREAGFEITLYDPFFYPDPATLDAKYDFVTCTEVVEHLHRPAEVFDRLDSLLKPGGWLGIMTCFQTDDARFDNWHYRRDPTHVVFYQETTFRWLAGHHDWLLEVPRKDVVLLQKR